MDAMGMLYRHRALKLHGEIDVIQAENSRLKETISGLREALVDYNKAIDILKEISLKPRTRFTSDEEKRSMELAAAFLKRTDVIGNKVT